MDNVRYYKPDEAAEYLRVSRRTVYRYLTDGALAASKTAGGRWLISEDALKRFIGEETGAEGK